MLHKNREEYRIYALRQLGTLVLTLKPKAWTITELSENSLLTFLKKKKKKIGVVIELSEWSTRRCTSVVSLCLYKDVLNTNEV